MEIGANFRIIFKDQDVFKLGISAWNGSFGGGAEVYVAIGELREAALALKGFPLTPSDERKLTFGTFDPEFAGGGIDMNFHCLGGAGHAFVEIKMNAGYVSAGTVQTVLMSMPIDATAVDAFIQGLIGLERHDSGTATLKGMYIR